MKRPSGSSWIIFGGYLIFASIVAGLGILWLSTKSESSMFWAPWEDVLETARKTESWKEFLGEFFVLGLLVLVWESLHGFIHHVHERKRRREVRDALINLLNFLFVVRDVDAPPVEKPKYRTPMNLKMNGDPGACEDLQLYLFHGEPILFFLDALLIPIRDMLFEEFDEDLAKIYSCLRDLEFLNARHLTLAAVSTIPGSREREKVALNQLSIQLSMIHMISRLKKHLTEHGVVKLKNGQKLGLSISIRLRLLNPRVQISAYALEYANHFIDNDSDLALCYANAYTEYLECEEGLKRFAA